MAGRKNQRKLNLITHLRAQVVFFMPFFVLLLIHIGTALLVQRQIFDTVVGVGDSLLPTDLMALSKLQRLSADTLTVLLGGIFLSAAASFFFWAFFSRRIFGPMVPIQRQIEKLKSSNYEGQIHLRKYDEFKSLAESINGLTQSLQTKVFRSEQKKEDT